MPLPKLLQLLLRLARAVPQQFIPLPDESSSAPRDLFYAEAARQGNEARVLDLGTRRWHDQIATHSFHLFREVQRANYVMADKTAGQDVDVLVDLHELPGDWNDRFNAVIAIAVFEHLERPWIAAREIARVLAPGGFCYVATHHTYPLHAFPSDFFRFSKEALALLFSDAGLEIEAVAYEHRAQIFAPLAVIPFGLRKAWNRGFPSYLVVHLLARRRA